ncbi:RagB/SusD family nutrient uptake outer membrane protein [Marinilabilia rubra]|uniref:RagB/SusD family nutrient uptake outer membrane protein n=2 Tax=Marinilabilia rubra TaxID=2162893 RepID=A0A2U2B9M7_9BACT|nr:RagB/SusD family nutrient uptake outer membrane protein [Marinilabilia rubra]
MAVSHFSCEDYLDRYPLDEISPDSFWKTEQDLQSGLNNMYQYLNMRAWDEDVRTADCFPSGGNIISSGSLTPNDNESENIWNLSYQQIRAVHEFLDYYNRANETEEVKNRYRGEALFFRAYFHYQLLRHFGDVPIVTRLLNAGDEEVFGTRDPRSEVMDQIIEDLQWAADNLPARSWIETNRPNEVGRITKGAALTFLSRVALYEGTFEKYHGMSGYDKYLQTAIDASNEVINSGEYQLASNFENLFLPQGEDNEEVIFSYRYSKEIDEPSRRPTQTVEVNRFMPTKYLADAFLCSDGLPIDQSPLFQGYGSLTSEFENRDPRMKMTIWEPASDNHPQEGESQGEPVLSVSPTGYYFKKAADYNAYQNEVFTDEIKMRYAEVLLNYAEATYELNGSISDADLDKTVNALRARVGMSVELTNSFVSANGLSMLNEIRRERRVELAAEGLRYDDIIRRKTAEDQLPQAIKGFLFHQDVYPELVVGTDVQLDGDGFVIAQSADVRFFDPDKNYLLPLPSQQLTLNPNLEDNPNWSN